MRSRGRPFVTLAIVAAAGYLAGRIVQRIREDEASEYARITAYEATANGVPETPIERLRELGQLHAQGVLNDEEFAAAKAQLLSGG
jgi:Short C-terminal domain